MIEALLILGCVAIGLLAEDLYVGLTGGLAYSRDLLLSVRRSRRTRLVSGSRLPIWVKR